MVNQQLLDYVKKNIEQMNAGLSGQGWSESEINEAILETQKISVKGNTIPVKEPTKKKESEFDINIELKNLSASQILLYIGGIVVVLAGVIYIGINWSKWNGFARIITIFIPTLVCYIVGSSMFFHGSSKKQGITFLTVGSVLLPLFLSILFKELKIFEVPFNSSFNLTVSAISFVTYIISSAVFKFPIWSFLYQGACLSILYFFLRLIGVDYNSITMAWLFLIPGTIYLLLSNFYDKKGREVEGSYSYSLGVFTIVIAFARLFGETFFNNNPHLAYLFIIFGILYFLIGIFYEKRNNKKYCQAPYAIGLGIILLSLFRLSVDGTLIKDFTGSSLSFNQDMIGLSFMITGIFYTFVGFAVEKMKTFKLDELSKFKIFFDFVCPTWILWSIFSLGLGGHKPGYETLLLISSLIFIFGSIPKASRQYLYIGTISLVVYIFSIGGEYFQNSIGWPITLFIAGLISMGIGVIIEKVRRKYFPNN